MGACVPECARNYLFDDDINIKGNKIFKKINTNLNIKDMKLSKDGCAGRENGAFNNSWLLSLNATINTQISGARYMIAIAIKNI